MTAILLMFIAFVTLNTIAYCFASYPERASSFWYKLPGGGVAAFFKYPPRGEK